MRSFFQDLMIKKLLTWYENFLLKGSLNSLLNPWENNFKLKFMTKSQVHTINKDYIYSGSYNLLQLFSLFWSQKVYIHINQHFFADPIMYRKSNFVFVLPIKTWKNTLKSRVHLQKFLLLPPDCLLVIRPET